MNDTVNVKDLALSTVGATQLPGSARAFARIASSIQNQFLRLSSHLGSLSPTIMRIAHQPRKNGIGVQRSLFAIDQTLTRVDAQSNPISKNRVTVAFQVTVDEGVTLAEYRTACATLLGALTETDGALITSLYYAEQ